MKPTIEITAVITLLICVMMGMYAIHTTNTALLVVVVAGIIMYGVLLSWIWTLKD